MVEWTRADSRTCILNSHALLLPTVEGATNSLKEKFGNMNEQRVEESNTGEATNIRICSLLGPSASQIVGSSVKPGEE